MDRFTGALAALLGLLLAGAMPPASADVVVTISGNVAVAEIVLPSAAQPTYTATLRLEFEAPENISAANLGIAAAVLDPLDPSLRARLPDPSLLVPAGFPVLVTVEPPPGAVLLASSFEPGDPGSDELGFRNSALVELRTPDLSFSNPSSYRLLRAPLGGAFVDITADVVEGSVRTRARTGGFSEFLIAEDPRDDAVRALEEYVRIDLRLDDPLIAPATRASLEAALAQSRAQFDGGAYAAALTALLAFDALLAATTPDQVPNRYRARRDLDNARGEVESLSANLAFFLRRLEGD
jgi:hypothetical protein